MTSSSDSTVNWSSSEGHRFTLGSPRGPVLEVLDLGATVDRLFVTCGDDVRRNVLLSHPSAEQRLASSYYLGSSIGRYANRIAGGRFPLAGSEVQVVAQDRGNALHGGPDGFAQRVWDLVERDASSITLSLVSPDGDQGFPGTLTALATYLVQGNTVTIRYEATTDAPTVVNLTSHPYFNLDGEGSGTVDRHELQVFAQSYTPVDETDVPTGAHELVAGTPFDLRTPVLLGAVVRSGHPQVVAARGLNHNFVVDGFGLRTAAVLVSRRSKTELVLATDQPGLQVYTGNFFDGSACGGGGALLRQGDGVALEAGLFPDTPNHPEWPSALLRPGESYTAVTTWTFGRLD